MYDRERRTNKSIDKGQITTECIRILTNKEYTRQYVTAECMVLRPPTRVTGMQSPVKGATHVHGKHGRRLGTDQLVHQSASTLRNKQTDEERSKTQGEK